MQTKIGEEYHESGTKSNVRVILEDKKMDLSKSTLVTGWHGLAECGFITVDHIVKSTEAQRIGSVLSKQMPPFVTMQNGRLSHPLEIYKYRDLVILVPLFEPTKLEQPEIAETMVNWAMMKGIRRTIIVGGLDDAFKDQNDSSNIRIVPTREYTNSYGHHDYMILEENHFVTTMMALILLYSDIKKHPALGLLAYARRGQPDPLASQKALHAISKITGIDIEDYALTKDALEIEEKIEKIRKTMQLNSSKDKEEEVGSVKDVYT